MQAVYRESILTKAKELNSFSRTCVCFDYNSEIEQSESKGNECRE